MCEILTRDKVPLNLNFW